MKILSAEEAAKLPGIGRGRNSMVRKVAANLEVGQAMLIEKGKDWFGKKSPYYVINYLARQTGRKFDKKALVDGTGWVVARIG